MQRRDEYLEEKYEKLQSRLSQLEELIEELKSEIESKDIIIAAFVSQAKASKRKSSNLPEKYDEEPKRLKSNEAKDAVYRKKELTGIESTEIPTVKEPNSFENTIELVSQIRNMFSPKSKNIDFKPNYTFKKFVDYAEHSYEFSLMNKKVSKSKNPMKLFIETNLDRLIKYIVANINILNLNQICSTLFLINSEISYKHKLVIVHDIILELDNYSKLNFICSALFNNLELDDGLFSNAIHKILFHQFCIDSNLFSDPEIIEHLNTIRDNLKLASDGLSLWDILPSFLAPGSLFSSSKSSLKTEAIEKGFIIRMVGHYLDWNYTYNTFIVSQLYPRLSTEKSPVFVYYLGVLVINAARMFKNDPSVVLILDELRSILNWNDECSVVAYLILHQFFEVEADTWININQKIVEGLGYDVGHLKKTLLL